MHIDTAELGVSLRRLAAGQGEGAGVMSALHEVTMACVDLFQVSGSGIMIADEQNITRYVASSDGPGRFLEELESATGQGPCTEAFVDNQLVDSADVTVDDRCASPGCTDAGGRLSLAKVSIWALANIRTS